MELAETSRQSWHSDCFIFPAARENGKKQKKATPDGLVCSKKYT
jgi:hypothetical protein